MLATSTGNYAVTNVTYNEISIMSSCELFISSPRCTYGYADVSDYVISMLCATLLVGSVAVQC